MRRAQMSAVAVIAMIAGLVGPPAFADVDGPMPGPLPFPTDEPVPTPVINCRTIEPAPSVDLSNCDLSDADLSGANLSYANLTNANLSGADLTDAVLLGATAPRADFSSASLVRTTFINADLRSSNLSHSLLRNVTFNGATLSDADLDFSDVRSTSFVGADLANADVSEASLSDVDFTSADLRGVDATGVDFSDATVTAARFENADLSGANFTGLDLTSIAFTRADATGARFVSARMARANLSGVNLTDTSLLKADLSHTKQAGATWHNTVCPDGLVTTGAPCPGTAVNEAGFLPVGAISYRFHVDRDGGAPAHDIEYTTTPVNLFYEYQPVDASVAAESDAPLFVMLNGGPGAATTANLMANNTARYTVNTDALPPGSPGFAINPDSWTSMGNLLYIDPAQTGFSYSIDPAAPNDLWERVREYIARGNFNPFIDADQVLRAVLQFMDEHPDIADNPVILVGESYGGTRVSTMLNMLLFSQRYDANGPSFFRDPGLTSAIARHFTAIGVRETLTPTVVARQFGRQVLIQPQLSNHQTDVQSEIYWPADPNTPSPIDVIAEKTGHKGGFTRDKSKCKIVDWWFIHLAYDPGACAIMVYVPEFGRDRYNWQKPTDWSDNQEAATAAQYNELGKLNTILGVDVAKIPQFPASARRDNAYAIMFGKPWRPSPGGGDSAKLAALVTELGLDANAEITSSAPLVAAIARREQGVDEAIRASNDADSLVAHFGKLNTADRYYSPWNDEVYIAFAANSLAPEYRELPLNADTSEVYGNMFLENVKFVETFLTDADFDLVINSQALPLALERHAGVAKVSRQSAAGDGSGVFVISYTDGSQRHLTYPRYAQSGHAVAASQPAKLRTDLTAWLQCTDSHTCFVD